MKRYLAPLATLFILSTASAVPLHIEGVESILERTKKQVKMLPPKLVKTMIDADEQEFHLIDIREPDQQAHGEIFHYNLHQITRGYLEFQVEEAIPDKDAIVILYCCSGKRSLLAARSLLEMGYTNVFSLEGGIRGWVEEGLPLDTVYGEMVLKQ